MDWDKLEGPQGDKFGNEWEIKVVRERGISGEGLPDASEWIVWWGNSFSTRPIA
jgi:hypothetical protein